MFKKALTINELKGICFNKIPKMFYDYIESGSWNQLTKLQNENDFNLIKFKQRVARNITNRNIQTTLINEKVTMPVILAPAGFTGMISANGEIKAAKAAIKFGIPFTLSTMSICSIEEVSKNINNKPFWFQIYVMKDRKFIKNLIERAKLAGCSALMLTLDLQLLGQRHLDIKNGLSAPPKLNLKNILNIITKPYWCYEMLQTKNHYFGNIVGYVNDPENPVDDLSSLSSWISSQFDPKLNWYDIKEIRQWWGNSKFILKGIMDKEDIKEMIQVFSPGEIDAIVISNHGGRQLDSTISSISILSELIECLHEELIKNGRNKNEIEVWLDSGIRSGQDVLKAIALGAKGTMIGRPYLYGLGAGGEEGVLHALNIIHKELDLTLGLCGENDINNINEEKIIAINPFKYPPYRKNK